MKKKGSYSVFLNIINNNINNENLTDSCDEIKDIIHNNVIKRCEQLNNEINSLKEEKKIVSTKYKAAVDSEFEAYSKVMFTPDCETAEEKYKKKKEELEDLFSSNSTTLYNLQSKKKDLIRNQEKVFGYLDKYLSNQKEKARKKFEKEIDSKVKALVEEQEKLERSRELKSKLLKINESDLYERAERALLLIKRGARLTQEDFKGYININNKRVTVAQNLIEPCLTDTEFNLIEQLINMGLDITEIDSDGNSLFHLTCDANNLNLAKFLLEKYAPDIDINARNKKGETALAIVQNHPQEEYERFSRNDSESGWLGCAP